MNAANTPGPRGPRMSRWGVGPAFALASLSCAAIATALAWRWPSTLGAVPLSRPLRVSAGVVLILAGAILYAAAAAAVMRAYSRDSLCTSGPFRACRHPVYAAWVFLVAPGLALLCGAANGLAVPIAMFLIARVLVVREERYLERRFGEAYRVYRARVPALLPIGWIRGRSRC